MCEFTCIWEVVNERDNLALPNVPVKGGGGGSFSATVMVGDCGSDITDWSYMYVYVKCTCIR